MRKFLVKTVLTATLLLAAALPLRGADERTPEKRIKTALFVE